jgi:DNA-binding beta-propeller fold protein YncE
MLSIIGSWRAIPDWGRGPDAPDLGLISTVATDSRGVVYVLCRAPRAVMHVFASGGRFLHSWTEHAFVQPHGLWIGPDDRVYTTDIGDHTVRIFTTDGALLQTIGTPGETGASGMPFNGPTRAVVGPSGDIYVSDGYGQNRLHRFTSDGRLVLSWGEPGAGPGQFDTPHSLWVDGEERVYVVDRGNSRVQVFDGAGVFLAEWTGLCSPHDIFLRPDGIALVTDCAVRIPGATVPYFELMPAQPIRIFANDGVLIEQWGEAGAGAGQFLDCPHSLWIDPAGDIYVSEVVTHNRLQKFGRGDSG